MFRAIIASLGLIATLLLLTNWRGATGYELLLNGGFESGASGWSVTAGQLDAVGAPVRNGALAGRLIGTGQPSTQEVYQWPAVQPDQTYEFGGWILSDDPDLQSVYLRVNWFDAGGSLVSSVDSPAPLTGADANFRFLTTGPVTSPTAARSARVGIRVLTNGGFTVHLDDFSFQGPEPTPALTPTTTPAETPEPTPTTTPATTATPETTVTPTSAPASTPAPTNGPSATPTPMATPTRTPTPTPGWEPEVFPYLVNGGFEKTRVDGTPYGWRKVGGTIDTSQAHHAEGSRSLVLTSESTSTKWAYQTVAVIAGSYYAASAAASSDPNSDSVFLRISWYETDDASGEAIGHADSSAISPASSALFHPLSTGPIRAPADARTAKVRLMLRPTSEAATTAYFDAVAFQLSPAPSPTPTPTPSPPPQVPEDTATPTLAPTEEPTPALTPTPQVYPHLVNGGFEDVLEDGAPAGWRKAGGEMAITGSPVTEGDLALAFTSRTAATKWVYQVVLVEPGAYYAAAVQALSPGQGVETIFMRISWYESEDGSGEAIGSTDSTEALHGAGAGFQALTTGPMQAPSDARSAKVKLMLRPSSDTAATAYFDAATFETTAAPPTDEPSPPATPSASPTPASTLDEAPAVFTALTNGGFEQDGPDGAPFGWRNVGGEMSSAGIAAEGVRALSLTSRTSSTKWAHQTILVEPGSYYSATAMVMLQSGTTAAFIRISWYESEDGGGEAISSADSASATVTGVFEMTKTGPVRAPSEARSAKVRLMLRPASTAETVAIFDAVTFAPAPPPPEPASAAAGMAQATATPGGATKRPTPTPAVLGFAATPLSPADARPTAAPQVTAAKGGSSDDWLLAFAIGGSLLSLGMATGFELRRAMRRGS